MINTKNVMLSLGVIFGALTCVCVLYVIPCCLLLIISAIHSFEMSIKRRKMIEVYLDTKLKSYEDEKDSLKRDFDKIKLDLENFKSRISVTQMYGQKSI